MGLTTWKGPGKRHDDVTKIVGMSCQAPPARGKESLTSWGKNGFLICKIIIIIMIMNIDDDNNNNTQEYEYCMVKALM